MYGNKSETVQILLTIYTTRTSTSEGGNVSSLKEQLNKMTYEDICRLYNIPE